MSISQIRTEIQIEEPVPYRVIRMDVHYVTRRAYIIHPAEEPPITYILLPYGVYPYSWLLLPATIILTIGILSIIYAYLVKRAYG